MPAPTATTSPPPTADRHRARWGVVAIALLAALPYLNALGGDFVFDDVGVIRDNPVVQYEPAWRVLTWVYEPGAYRPLTMLSYVANARVSQGPFGFHAVNVVLHVAVALAVYALALRLLAAPRAAWIGAALFAVHPIHTEAVSSIVGRAESLAALAALGALLALTEALDATGPARRRWLVASWTAFAVALLCKESAFTTIGLVLVVHWYLAPADRLRRRAALLAPYVVIGVAYLGLRLLVVGALSLPTPPAMLDNPLAHVDPATRLRTAAVVLWDYVAMLIAPVRLSADYSFNQVPLVRSWSEPRLLAALVVLGGLSAVVLAGWRRWSPLAVAAAFFAIPLALTANLVGPIGTIKAERLLYLPSLGFCLAAGWLLAGWADRRPRAAGVAVAALLALFAARTWVRNADWADQRALYTAAVRVAPESAKAHHNLAVALQQDGELDDALIHYQRAFAIYPYYAAAAFGIGHIATLRGDDATALRWYEVALQRDPQLTKAYLQLGLLRQRQGDYPDAEAAFAAGLASEPDNPLLLVNLAAARLAQGNRWGAREALERLDRIAPPTDQHTVAVVAAARHEIEVAVQ